MAKVQPEGSKIRIAAGAKAVLVVTMPAPKSLCAVAGPAGINIKETATGSVRKFAFTGPAAPWSGTFLIAVAFVPDANGDLDPNESFKIQIDDPTTAGIDVDVSTIRPRPGNLNPIPFVIDFVV